MTRGIHPRILIVDDSLVITEVLHQLLTGQGYDVERANTGEEAYERAVCQPPDMIVSDLVLPGMDGYQLCRRLRQNPATRSLPILMVTAQDEIQDKVAGFESGVDDYLTKPFEPEELVYRVKGLLGRAKSRSQSVMMPGERGRTIAFFGGKGGVGKTTLAVNLAVAIQRRAGKRVALFDADFCFGDVGVHLGLPQERNVIDLIKYINDLTPELADDVLATHDSGVRVLLNPARPEEADLIDPAHVRRLLHFLADLYDYVVVDCQPSYDERMLVVLEQADEILLVITPEIGPIKNTSHFLNLAARLGLALDKIHIILNRANSDVGIGLGEIERTLKHRVAYQIVSGGRPVVVSVNRGAPIVLSQGDHPLAQQVMRMADHMMKQAVKG